MSNPLVPSKPLALPPPGKASGAQEASPPPIPPGAALVRLEAKQRRLPRMPRGWRLVGTIAATLVVLAIVRLSVAPLSIPISGLVASAVNDAAGTDIRIGKVGVALEWGAIALTIDDVRLRTPTISATLPRANVLQGLSGRWVRIDAPAVRLNPMREATGGIALPHPDDAVVNLDAALDGLKEAARQHGLRRAEIANGRLDVYSPGRPITEARVFRSVNAVVDLDSADEVFAEASALGADGPISASLSRIVTGDASAIDIAAEGLSPKDFAPIKPVRNGFPVSLSFSTRLEPAGVSAATLALEIGEGTFVFGRDPPRTLDEARVVLTRQREGDILLVEDAWMKAGPTSARIEGFIEPAREAGHPWAFDLYSTDAVFDAPEFDTAPVVPRRIDAAGVLDMAQQLISVDRFHADLVDATVTAALDFDFSSYGPLFSGSARVSPSSIPLLLGAWPPITAHEPRMAVAATVLGGFLTGGEMTFALTPLELDGDPTTNDMIEGGLAIDAEFVGATLSAPGAPIAVKRARGAFRMRDKSLSVRVDAGEVDAGDGGRLTVKGGTMVIPTLEENPARAILSLEVEGPASSVVSLANQFDVPQLKDTPLEPADISGSITATVNLRTPLGDDVPDEARAWSIDARLTNAGSRVPIAGRTFSDANIEVLVNPRRLAARGRAKVDGLSIDVNYSELFDGEKSGAVRFVLTDRDRRSRGFDTGTMLQGPVTVTLEQGEDDARLFAADLAEAAIAASVFNKGKGIPLSVIGAVEGEPPNMVVNDLRVTGGDVRIAGALEVAEGALERLLLEDFALSRGDDARLAVARDGDGYAVRLDAARFDVRDLLEGVGKAGGGEGAGDAPPFEADVSAESLRISDQSTVSGFSANIVHDGEELVRASVRGRVDGVNAGGFAVELKPSENGTRRLQADVTELGRLLAALEVYARMQGGRTVLDARLDSDGVAAGRLTATDFVLANEKTLEQIVRQAGSEPFGGNAPLGYAPQPGIDGMSFDKLSVSFTKRGDTIEIGEAILRGPILGGTATGAVNLKSRTVLLNGTLIPAYGVNNLFGRVPIVGEILGGGNEGGLIGVTFRLVGPIDNPQLLVNPMSAIAPGIFRKIFEFR